MSVEIRIIKEYQGLKVGEIFNTNKESADNFIKNGFAEYITKPQKTLQEEELVFLKFRELAEQLIVSELYDFTSDERNGIRNQVRYAENINILKDIIRKNNINYDVDTQFNFFKQKKKELDDKDRQEEFEIEENKEKDERLNLINKYESELKRAIENGDTNEICLVRDDYKKYKISRSSANTIYNKLIRKKAEIQRLNNNPERNSLNNQNIPEDSKKILEDKNLFNNITKEFNKKIVGEEQSIPVIFLCSCGKLVENHQIASYNLLVNDDAGCGKDYVVSNVCSIWPNEFYIHKTRISPTAFTYWHNSKFEPQWTWDGKIFYAEDISENVLNSDTFKVMSSGGSSATIVINQMAMDIEINGKPVIITTTASATPNPELTRRFIILFLDSSIDQTKAIMKRHAEFKKKGIDPEINNQIKESLKYLERRKVIIPFADLVDKYFPSNNIMMRTNFPRFLDFISASTCLHQYQRNIDENGFLIAEGQDYDIARECFMKICSNKFMVNLTINQKKILDIFDRDPFIEGSVTKLHREKFNFISDRALSYNLQLLVKYGFLTTDVRCDSMNREIEIFKIANNYKPNEKLIIPYFKELISKDDNKGVSK